MPELHKAIARLMEERHEVSGADTPALRALLQAVSSAAAGGERALVESFTRALFEKSGASLLTARKLPELAAMTLGALRWISEGGGAGRVRARVFVPTLERDGWTSPHLVIESLLSDRPFIVDTLQETVRESGAELRVLLHPLLGVRRDAEGRPIEIKPAATMPERESFVHMEVAAPGPLPDLEALVLERLEAVVVATEDYAAMRARLAGLVSELHQRRLPEPWGEEVAEAGEFLTWLGQKNFVFLGYREYVISGEGASRGMALRPGSGLGILRNEQRSRYRSLQPLQGEERRRIEEGPLLVISKTRRASPVHRIAPMDYLSLKQLGSAGTVIGERRILGLFTSKAYHEPPSTVPILRWKLGQILEREGIADESHDYRDMVGLFNSFPKEELLATPAAEIRSAMRAILAAEGQSAVRLLARRDVRRRGWFVTVLLPRARYSTELAQRVLAEVQSRLEGQVLNQHLALDDRMQARLHYYVLAPPDRLGEPVAEMLERQLNTLLRTWDDQLRQRLAETHSPGEADRLVARYGVAFSAAYKSSTPVEEAERDIRCLEQLLASGTAQIEFRALQDGTGASALKLFLAGEEIVLSDFIPVLENLGLRVYNQDFVDLNLPRAERIRMHTFVVRDAGEPPVDPVGAADSLVSALHALRAGQLENDRLNSLILHAGLEWRAVDALRTYVHHARQIDLSTSPATLIEALTSHPESARLLFRMFTVKFDPRASPLPPNERLSGPVEEARLAFLASLEGVESLVHDRILRALGAAVQATVRTNFHAPRPEGPEAEAIVIKLAGAELAHLPEPRPMFEAYVHSPHAEGIHLRAGPVARGGIRLSDRPDDFRTEILGLMKTQVVKNAVIVPVGAKGGFVLKGKTGRPAPYSEVERAYRTLIGALLSITDNIGGGRIVPPPGVLAYDRPDPYLVVAADKGTATLSDVANAVAARYGFWLGDAFASGGSNGYDHKKLAITARGAWECVRHHFRELGRDVDREPVTVIGIGDMSGDVFGNGLLRSRNIRLLAAFNHRHIFLDPEPDPERSYEERERLFLLPRSGWDDYDPALISPGGGIYLRSAKVVPLSPVARSMLAIESDTPSGEEVIRAILCMPADLLWNGGIGTYVKSSEELHSAVGDPGNDAVRVNADQLRVRVVAEGGNLGFTQRARVELALRGGRINTDAIDNSGGVDLSDHEVNLKIALQPALLADALSPEERNALLTEIGDEVCEAVLVHNRRQALALSLDQRRSRTALADFRTLMTMLETEGGLDRQLEALPTREALRARRATFVGLTRPELAVLLAHSKLDLQRRILGSSLRDDPAVASFFELYFPTPAKARFADSLRAHRLREEITAVELANWLIDSMGMAFLVRIATHTGCEIVEGVRAWAAAMEITGAHGLLHEIESARPRLGIEGEARCLFTAEQALERATKWLVETQPPAAPVGELVRVFAEPARRLLSVWPQLIEGEPLDIHQNQVAQLVELEVPAPLAERVVRLEGLPDALEITHIATELEMPLPRVAEIYLRAPALVDVQWIRQSLLSLTGSEDRWEQRAVEGLLEGLTYARRRLTRNVLLCHSDNQDVTACLQHYQAAQRPQLSKLSGLIKDLKAVPQPSLAALQVVMRELGRLVGR